MRCPEIKVSELCLPACRRCGRAAPSARLDSQMPRHLISGAHEWINEIPTVPIYYLAKPQPRERTWEDQRGKKTLLCLTLVCCCTGRLEADVVCRWEKSVATGKPYLAVGFANEIPPPSCHCTNSIQRTATGGEFDWGGTSVKR